MLHIAACCAAQQHVVRNHNLLSCCNVLGHITTTLSGICAPWSGMLRGRADSDRLHRSKERVAVQPDPTPPAPPCKEDVVRKAKMGMAARLLYAN